MFLQVLAIHPLLRLWGMSFPVSKHDVPIFLAGYTLYQGLLFGWPCLAALSQPLPPATALIIVCEQLRFIMKTHAFVREVIDRSIVGFRVLRVSDSLVVS